MENTVELATDLLRPSGHAVSFCTAQQFSVKHRFFAVVSSAQHHGSSFSLSSGTEEILMVSAAFLTFENHSSHQRSSSLRNSCTLDTAVLLALHPKKNAKLFAKEKNKASYMQFGFLSSAIPGYGTFLVTTGVRNVMTGSCYPRDTLAREKRQKGSEQSRNRTFCSESWGFVSASQRALS